MQAELHSSREAVTQLRDELNTMKAMMASLANNIGGQTLVYKNIVTHIYTTDSPAAPLDFEAIWATTITPAINDNKKAIIRNGVRAVERPSDVDTPAEARETGQLCQFGGNGGDNGGYGGNPHDDGDYQTTITVRDSHDNRSEFVLVTSTNIIITTFSGTSLIANPHMRFYKSLRRLIHSQGEGGEELLEVLGEVEKRCNDAFTIAQLKELVRQRPKAAEYNRAILTALMNYTTGIARGMVEFGVRN